MLEFIKKPGFLPTHGNMGTDLSFLMALVFTTLFIIGWRMAKKKQGNQHHTLVLWAMVSMLTYFTVYYLARGLGALATEGEEGFGGPEWVYNYIFLPLLNIHILVVSVGLILAVYMIVLGFRAAVKRNGRRVLQTGILTVSQKNFIRLTAIFFIVFGVLAIVRCCVDGQVVVGRLVVYFVGFLLVLSVLFLEKGIERLIPDGARRHRLIGTFTMVLYVIALFTSSITYIMLYVIWPPGVTG